jgi:hypothetical protein
MTNTKHNIGLVTLKMYGVEFEVEVACKEEDGTYKGVVWNDMPTDSPIQFDDEIVFSDEDTMT